jgi:hypothetical protein
MKLCVFAPLRTIMPQRYNLFFLIIRFWHIPLARGASEDSLDFKNIAATPFRVMRAHQFRALTHTATKIAALRAFLHAALK